MWANLPRTTRSSLRSTWRTSWSQSIWEGTPLRIGTNWIKTRKCHTSTSRKKRGITATTRKEWWWRGRWKATMRKGEGGATRWPKSASSTTTGSARKSWRKIWFIDAILILIIAWRWTGSWVRWGGLVGVRTAYHEGNGISWFSKTAWLGWRAVGWISIPSFFYWARLCPCIWGSSSWRGTWIPLSRCRAWAPWSLWFGGRLLLGHL